MLEIPQQGKRRALFRSQSRRRKTRDLASYNNESKETSPPRPRSTGQHSARIWLVGTTLAPFAAPHSHCLADSVDRRPSTVGRREGTQQLSEREGQGTLWRAVWTGWVRQWHAKSTCAPSRGGDCTLSPSQQASVRPADRPNVCYRRRDE